MFKQYFDAIDEQGWYYVPSLIRHAVNRFQRVCIFGIGGRGLELRKLWADCGGEVVCFSDNNPDTWGADVDGIPVVPPEDARVIDSDVFIASHAWNEIRRQLLGLSCKSVNVYGWQMTAMWAQFPTPSEAYFEVNMADLDRVVELLADEESCMAYVSPLKAQQFRNHLFLRPSQYPLHGHPVARPAKGDVILNCGAFDGDSDLAFHAMAEGCEIHSFEPHPDLFRRVVAMSKSVSGGVTIPVNKGVWKEDGRLTFIKSDGRGGASSVAIRPVADEGECDIVVCSIDGYCRENGVAPNLIKMDVEGAEPEALAGAVETIRKHRPKLQIAINHSLEQRISVPLQLGEMLDGYRFHCGHHNEFNPGETIFYCLPR